MPFGAHETMEVHEILNEKINMLNHFRLYREHCQNGQIRQMLDRHIDTAVQSYNQLVAYTHDYSAANAVGTNSQMGPDGYATPQVSPQQIQYGLRQPEPQAPQMAGSRLNDQQVLMGMLALHKSSAGCQMRGALECADPNVRNMLIQGAVTCANQAYEVFLMMNQQGQYQVPTMNDKTAKTYLHAYQPIQDQPPMM